MGGYAGAALLGVCGMLLAPRLATDAELCVALVVALGCAAVRIGRWFVVLVLAVVVATLEARSRLDAWLPPPIENTKLSITGVVDSVPQRRADAVRFDVAVEPQAGMQLPRRIELSWYDCPDPPHATERWAFDVRLRRPRGFANPGGADLAARLLRETTENIAGIADATGFSDQSYFDKRFKRAFGKTPKEFRAERHESQGREEQDLPAYSSG